MAATSTQAEVQVSLKLVLNEKGNKVLFAEAGKDFVDILCSFLTIPLGTVARLVEKESSIGPVTVGCLNSLYQSVVDLDEGCLSTDTIKQVLLEPSNSAEDYCNTLKLNIDDTPPTKYFACQGFVESFVTFVITDDLTVVPNGIDFTSFSMLQEFGIQCPSSVKEIALNVTKEKVLDLLKCYLLPKSTLTDWFLGKKPSLGCSRFFLPYVEIRNKIQMTLKLVIRKSDGKVLYAQGEQDFANLLLSFLTFPLGGIARIFQGNCSIESINELYKCISLNEDKYSISCEAKYKLIKSVELSKQILPIHGTGFFECYKECESYIKFFKRDESNSGRFRKFLNPNIVNPYKSYVKGPGMYVATDDLVVSPLSPVSALSLLARLKTPLNDLKEKVVVIGFKECLSILNAALTSTSALTNGLAHMFTEEKEDK
ncbi:uncharacterized protein LOC131614075 [Vicia villosa]|uniref:uncharacterized protein LOC131614075 n=1 Tax=Vicia villosa TaxID=3911 RepID=UPI00273B3147|nr:uncharacterized protein LOC131614075 [Vicia villosa]